MIKIMPKEMLYCEVCNGEVIHTPIDFKDKIKTMVWQCNDCGTHYKEKIIKGEKYLLVDKDYDGIID